MNFTSLCWSVSLCWLLWQWYQAWQVYLHKIAIRTDLNLVQKIPPFSLFCDADHRRTAFTTLLDSVFTIGAAQIIVEVVPGTSAAGVGAVVGLALSFGIRKAMSDYAQAQAQAATA